MTAFEAAAGAELGESSNPTELGSLRVCRASKGFLAGGTPKVSKKKKARELKGSV